MLVLQVLRKLRHQPSPILLHKSLAHERDALKQKCGNPLVVSSHENRHKMLLEHGETLGRHVLGGRVLLGELFLLLSLSALCHRDIVVRELMLLLTIKRREDE